MNKKFMLLLIIILILVLYPQTALNGAVNGLSLWFDVIVPTLLPFMIISYLIQNVYGSSIQNPLGYVFLIGLCCGYPMGAYAAVSMYKQGRVTQKEAYLLLTGCNISSPAFVLSYIAMSSLKITFFPWGVLLVNYLPALIIIIYLICIHAFTSKKENLHQKKKNMHLLPITNEYEDTGSKSSSICMSLSFETFDNAINSSVLNILKLGAYIIIFSILAAFLSILPIRNVLAKCLLIGSMEITTGINYAVSQKLDKDILFVLVLVLNSFGGLSCAFQSGSFFKGTDLNIKKYMYNKFLLAVLTFLIWYLLVHVLKFNVI